jgi:hypothetical protein
VLFYDKGRGWRFKEPYEPIEGNAVMGGKNSKPAAVKYLRENKDAKLEILFRRKVKIKEKAEQRRKEEAKRLSNK